MNFRITAEIRIRTLPKLPIPTVVASVTMGIITVEASVTMSTIHDRMPAILMPPEYDQWLDLGETEWPPTHLLRPYPETTLQIHPANPKVRNIRNQGIDMLEP